jgi:hypothetical protein
MKISGDYCNFYNDEKADIYFIIYVLKNCFVEYNCGFGCDFDVKALYNMQLSNNKRKCILFKKKEGSDLISNYFFIHLSQEKFFLLYNRYKNLKAFL